MQRGLERKQESHLIEMRKGEHSRQGEKPRPEKAGGTERQGGQPATWLGSEDASEGSLLLWA